MKSLLGFFKGNTYQVLIFQDFLYVTPPSPHKEINVGITPNIAEEKTGVQS